MSNLLGEDGAKLLDTIDQLRRLDIGDEISLPQIVVVGQQSSGKSSVLEAISGIPFPTDEGLCTRFATEVILRRAPIEHASVELIARNPGKDVDLDQRYNEFNKQLERDETDSPLKRLPQLLEKASEVMGVSRNRGFSNDYLSIQYDNPDQAYLTLVDLPGLFSVPKPGQVQDDTEIVRNLALNYMKQSRSIILAVISAKTDYVNQEILKILQDVDPRGSRTIGVITGVDAIEIGSGRENSYMELARNTDIHLKLGWHVLRNPGFRERKDPSLDRDKLEEHFFTTKAPWKNLAVSVCGAKELKPRLSRLLLTHIGRELKPIMEAINKAINDQKSTLDQLGPPRSTVQEQRSFLMAIGEKHQSLIKMALDGQYEHAFFLKTTARLRATVQQILKDFAHELVWKGHHWEFLEEGESYSGQRVSTYETSTPLGDDPSPEEKLNFPLKISKNDYLLKVQQLRENHRGRELDDESNPLLAGTLFRDQAFFWQSITNVFVGKLVDQVRCFVRDVTLYVTNSKRANCLYSQRLESELAQRHQRLEQKLREILDPFTISHRITYSPAYASLQTNKQPDITSDLKNLTKHAKYKPCLDLFERMQAYYGIAIEYYINNVATLGIEMSLLQGLENIMSPRTVDSMTVEDYRLLGGDFPEEQDQRDLADKKLAKLTKARSICQQYVVLEPYEPEPSARPSALIKLNDGHDICSKVFVDQVTPSTPIKLNNGEDIPGKLVVDQKTPSTTSSEASMGRVSKSPSRPRERRRTPSATPNTVPTTLKAGIGSPNDSFALGTDSNLSPELFPGSGA